MGELEREGRKTMNEPRSGPGHFRKLAFASVALLMVVGAVACSSDDDGTTSSASTTTSAASSGEVGTGPGTPAPQPLAEPATMTVVLSSPQEFQANLAMALAKGEFEKENLTVEVVNAPSPEGLALMATDEVQAQWSGFGVGLFNMAASQNAPVKGVASAHKSEPPLQGFYIRKEFLTPDGEPDLDALEGEAVIGGSGGGGWGNGPILPLWRWLKDNGLEIDHFAPPTTVSSMADALLALENGQAAISLVTTPLWQELQPPEEACCVLIEDTAGFAASQILMSTRFVEEEREVAKAFLRAIMRTNRTYLQGDYHADPEVSQILADYFDRQVEEYRQTPSLVFDPNLEIDLSAASDFQQMYREAGVLSYEEDIDNDLIADTSLLEEILAGR